MSVELTPRFADLQAHYDPPDDFLRLFSSVIHQTYSCAYFEREETSLPEAQISKIQLPLSKLGLPPGTTLPRSTSQWRSATNPAQLVVRLRFDLADGVV
jgi:cyclopropane-fatty-acyl-phospholipid synthase